jgi:hypothetical protein
MKKNNTGKIINQGYFSIAVFVDKSPCLPWNLTGSKGRIPLPLHPSFDND